MVPDGVSATFIALPMMKTSPVSVDAVQQRCGAGAESGDAAMENSSVPSGVEAAFCRVSGNCCGISHVEGAGFFFFSQFLTKTEWGRVYQAA